MSRIEKINKTVGIMNQFESESTIEERRKQRQEEWEKVRTADQPECESNNDAMAIRLIFNSSN